MPPLIFVVRVLEGATVLDCEIIELGAIADRGRQVPKFARHRDEHCVSAGLRLATCL